MVCAGSCCFKARIRINKDESIVEIFEEPGDPEEIFPPPCVGEGEVNHSETERFVGKIFPDMETIPDSFLEGDLQEFSEILIVESCTRPCIPSPLSVIRSIIWGEHGDALHLFEAGMHHNQRFDQVVLEEVACIAEVLVFHGNLT